MKKIALLLFIMFSLQITIAQEFEMIRHQVKMGETVKMISRKYKIEPAEIYRLNKFAVDGISQGQVLQLIVAKKEPVEVAETPVHDSHDEVSTSTTTTVTTTTVRRKVADDQPQASEPEPEVSGDLGESGSAVTHTVAKGETLIGIAKRYGISVSDIKSQNEKVLKRGLQAGQVLAIIKPGNPAEVAQVTESEPDAIPTQDDALTEIKHTVEKGDTLFHLAKKYQVSVADIERLNGPHLKKGLKIGQVLIIRTAE